MANQNYYDGVSHVVHVSSDESKNCEHCAFQFGSESFAESVNHYMSDHGYKLHHVGQETSRDTAGNPFQLTVAVIGK